MSPREALRFLERLATDPSLQQAMPQLVDFTGVDSAPTAAESETVAEGFARLRDCFEGARWAVVVSDALVYGAVRQFASMAARASVDVRPFLDWGEARRWLAVPDDFE